MRPSRLFGTLEMPGQKAYPSKDIEYGKFNPDQGVFEIKQALIRPKTSTGRLWNEFGKDLPKNTTDQFPEVSPAELMKGNWRKLSKATGSMNFDARASNPEMITGFGILPNYPFEEMVKSLISHPNAFVRDTAEPRRLAPMAEPTAMLAMAQQKKEKYGADKIQTLVEAGFSEEQIGRAIDAMEARDIERVLQNPSMINEAKVAKMLEEKFDKREVRDRVNQAEGGEGLGAATSIAGPGVTAYSAGAAFADTTILPQKTGMQRMMYEKYRKQILNPTEFLKTMKFTSAKARVTERKPKDRFTLTGMEVAEEKQIEVSIEKQGVAGGVGSGPGGEATFAVAIKKDGRGRPGVPKPAEQKMKIGQSVSLTAAKKKVSTQIKLEEMGFGKTM